MAYSTRRMVGAALAVLAAIAAVWSAFLNWYGGRKGSDIRIQDLFNQITTQRANTWGSLFIPLGVSALLILAGVVIQHRWLWVLGGLVAIATPVLWGVRQAQTPLGLHADLTGRGPALAAEAGALMLIAAVVAGGRRRRENTTARADEPAAMAAPVRPVAPVEPVATAEPAEDFASSAQNYQKGYEHGMEQASEKTADETLGQSRER